MNLSPDKKLESENIKSDRMKNLCATLGYSIFIFVLSVSSGLLTTSEIMKGYDDLIISLIIIAFGSYFSTIWFKKVWASIDWLDVIKTSVWIYAVLVAIVSFANLESDVLFTLASVVGSIAVTYYFSRKAILSTWHLKMVLINLTFERSILHAFFTSVLNFVLLIVLGMFVGSLWVLTSIFPSAALAFTPFFFVLFLYVPINILLGLVLTGIPTYFSARLIIKEKIQNIKTSLNISTVFFFIFINLKFILVLRFPAELNFNNMLPILFVLIHSLLNTAIFYFVTSKLVKKI